MPEPVISAVDERAIPEKERRKGLSGVAKQTVEQIYDSPAPTAVIPAI
jgi:hypothetical protein